MNATEAQQASPPWIRVPFGWRPDNKLGAAWWTGRDGENEHRKGGWGPLCTTVRLVDSSSYRQTQDPGAALHWRQRALGSGR